VISLVVNSPTDYRTVDVRKQVFDAEAISDLHNKLHDNDSNVRQAALNILSLAVNHGELSLSCAKVYTENGTDDLRNQVFDTETISDLHSKLQDRDVDVRQAALNVLGIAVNQGELSLLCQ